MVTAEAWALGEVSRSPGAEVLGGRSRVNRPASSLRCWRLGLLWWASSKVSSAFVCPVGFVHPIPALILPPQQKGRPKVEGDLSGRENSQAPQGIASGNVFFPRDRVSTEKLALHVRVPRPSLFIESWIIYLPDGPLEGGDLVSTEQTTVSFLDLNSSLATYKQDRG